MKMKFAIVLVSTLFFVHGAYPGRLLAAESEASTGARPNIVLVMADDQGAGDMGYYGHPKLLTPNFDSMAADGLRFDRFYAAAPLCSPTRGSVMTGRNPNRYACFCWGHPLRPQEITLAEVLKTAGYATGHFGKWHLGSVRRGSPVNPGESGFDRWFSAPNFFDNDPVMSDEGKAVETKGESSMVTVDAAIDFIKQKAAAKEPFFAVVWFGSPHGPHKALPEYQKLYPNEPKELQNFYGEITAMDRAFGKLRSEIKSLGIKENTILWYCSDNGGLKPGDKRGRRRGKGQIYDGGLLVPAILEWPERIHKPRVTDVVCTTSDIYPTILDIVGVHPKNQPPLDGVSLLPLIDGKMAQRSKPIGFWKTVIPGIRTPSVVWMGELLDAQREGREPNDPWKLRLDAGKIKKQYTERSLKGHSAWLDGDWKLHRIVPNKKPRKVRFELYNLADDPAEKHNVIAEHPEQAKKMKADLALWQKSVIDSLNGKDYSK